MATRILHLFLIFHLLITSSGVAVFEHVCRIKGTTISFFVKAESCCSKVAGKAVSNSCHSAPKSRSKSDRLTKKPCCEDNISFDKLNVNGSYVLSDITTNCLKAITPNKLSLNFEYTDLAYDNTLIGSFAYKPPLINKVKRTILYQTFLC